MVLLLGFLGFLELLLKRINGYWLKNQNFCEKILNMLQIRLKQSS